MIQDRVNEYWAQLRGRYRSSPLPAFLRWWRGELAGMLPAGLRRRMIPPRPVVLLLPDGDGDQLSVWAGSEPPEQRDLFDLRSDPALLRDRWRALLDEFRDGNPEVRLCLPPDQVLQCPVELPLAVESNLGQALRYQLDQITPFSADQVCFDYAVVERDPERGRLKLDLRLVPVARVDELTTLLGAIGVRPHAVDCLASADDSIVAEGFNLLSESERPRYVYARARTNWLLAGALVGVLAVVMAVSLIVRQQAVDRLNRDVEQLRAQAEAVLALQQELDEALNAANFLAEHRRQRPVFVRVLEEITRILPEDMWLQQLQLKENELEMHGMADGAQRLVELIDDAEMLADAEFRGSIDIDPNTGRERFRAAARVLTQNERDAAAAESRE